MIWFRNIEHKQKQISLKSQVKEKKSASFAVFRWEDLDLELLGPVQSRLNNKKKIKNSKLYWSFFALDVRNFSAFSTFVSSSCSSSSQLIEKLQERRRETTLHGDSGGQTGLSHYVSRWSNTPVCWSSCCWPSSSVFNTDTSKSCRSYRNQPDWKIKRTFTWCKDKMTSTWTHTNRTTAVNPLVKTHAAFNQYSTHYTIYRVQVHSINM